MNVLLKIVVFILVASAFVSATQVNAKSNDDTTCTLCQFVVSSVENYIANNQTITQIEALLNKVCFTLPAALQTECVLLVAQLPEIVKQLEQQYPVKQICTTLGLCTSKKIIVPKDTTSCTLCEFGVDQIEQYLAQNATQQQIVASLSYVCKLVPASFTESCNALVQQVPVVIKYIEQDYPAQTVCTMIGFCTSDKPQKLFKAVSRDRKSVV